jgi:hypothetical protein
MLRARRLGEVSGVTEKQQPNETAIQKRNGCKTWLKSTHIYENPQDKILNKIRGGFKIYQRGIGTNTKTKISKTCMAINKSRKGYQTEACNKNERHKNCK